MSRFRGPPRRAHDPIVDLYATLQVHPSADTDVIRAAYRALAMKNHPDAGGSATRMAEINDAWATLRDPVLRRRYDRDHGYVGAIGSGARDAAPAAGPNLASAAPTAPAQPTVAWSRRPRDAASSADDRTRRRGRVLDFGRYAGWSILELSRSDPDYLLWLERTPIGRSFRTDIAQAMDVRRTATMAAAASTQDGRRLGGWLR